MTILKLSNKNRFLMGVEIIALIISILFLILWVNEPSGPYEPFFAVGTTVFIGTEIYRRYSFSKRNELTSPDEHVYVNLDSKNIFFTRFKNNGHQRSGNIALIFYHIQITNISNRPFTIKSVNFKYEFNKKTINEISNVILTGSIYSPLEKSNVGSIILQLPKDQIVFMGWNNLRTEINKNKILNHGEILSGSAIYVLDISDENELEKINNPRLIVEDYSGNVSTHTFEIHNDWKKGINSGYIEPRQFKKDKNGEIEYW